MIAKIHSGQGFAGLVDYANDIRNKNADIIASEGVDLTSNKSITASFSLQSKSRPSLKNFVGHISLSFSPEDASKLNDRLMADIAKEYLQRMGIVNTQYIISRHHDKPHPHVHIVYNRVDNDGNAISGDQNFRKSAQITQALTREYGLTFGKGKKKVNRDRLKGRDAIKYRIHDIINEVLKDCRSIEALKTALATRGIGMNIFRNADGKAKGVVFTCDSLSFAGYQIDRSMTYANLLQRMGIEQEATGRNTAIPISDDRAEQQGFAFDKKHSDTPSDENVSRGTAASESLCGTNTAGGYVPAGNGIGAAVAELIIQPHIVPTSGGGSGSGNDRDWNDEDKDKNKKHNPYRRRR